MSRMPDNLDVAVLRALLAVSELGSFGKAAGRIRRSESAVSLQLRRLEQQVGQTLFHRAGRGLALTDAAESLLPRARELVALNDEILAGMTGATIAGRVRLGVPQDVADIWLPPALATFARAYPSAVVDVAVDRSPSLARRLDRDDIDLALIFTPEASSGSGWFRALPMQWIGQPGFRRPAAGPLRLAVFDPPCFFRAAGVAALDAEGLAWTVAFTGSNLASLWAAVAANLGITVRTPIGMPANLQTLGSAAALPQLPDTSLCLRRNASGSTALASRLADTLVGLLEQTIDASF